ncbi:monosaccharide ABC transporter substrate-binding protein, CUT2 family [Flexilinea flocculi]|jgi:simple sugar transport system substrate-binding protein|uniref:Monosaccharide ABC transporter substrate-binding protein, CUT2 family n=2 Tax=Flexilinea flocculi TaxID=1678840 RepID=A0A0S7BMR6_9CHLR|nr:ABC transporter substrate-binding protein [Flexilinea flocculi]NMB93590.1 ABC transporter substrate-binding protein [Flexilinea flocculi]GAP41765.1 monosaccharide ABC transporter substrate-binding protein, CUT2 family [Flexilinea flocculi]
MKKFVSMLVCVLIFASLFAMTVSAADLITVGYAQIGAESDWRTANTESFKSTFTEENGFKLIFDDAQQKQENQIKAIRNFIQQEVDYIVLAPIVETGWETVLGEAKEAGIPVILSDRQIKVTDDSLYVAWVGGNFLQEGYNAVEWLDGYLKENGRENEDINIVLLQGTIGSSAQVGRTEGVEKLLADRPKYHLLAKQTGEFTQAKGQEVMESFLKSYDDIDVVIAENDDMGYGAMEAIKAAGKVPGKDIIMISYDSGRRAFEKVIAGELNVTVECNPLHGPRVAEIIKKLEAGETVDKIQYVDEGVFDIKNAAEILPTRTY